MNEDSASNHSEQQPFTIQRLLQIHTSLIENLENNTNLRMKYPDQPEKFYQTEEQINNLIQDLSELSNEHLPIIIQSKILAISLKILEHPNIDLSMGIIQFLFEILQEEPQDDKLFQIYFRMSAWLLQNGFIQALILLLSKLNEESNVEEYETGLKILKLLDIFTNLSDQTYEILSQQKQIFEYLANRIMPNYQCSHRIIDDNKYVASDVLVALLTNSEKAQIAFSNFSGVEVILETISYYETKLPQNTDQKEFLNNLFSCLSVLLINFTLKQNKINFHELKGNYLMISFIKLKSEYSPLALKVIANSLSSCDKEKQTEIVHTIINDGGLKYLFAVLKRKGIRGADVDEQKSIDQNCLAIVYAMMRSSHQIFKDRIQHKLYDNKFENLERFFELRAQYAQNIGKQIDTQITQASDYITKLSEGLFVIQIIDKMILVIIQKYTKLKQKLKTFMQLYGVRVKDIQKIINEHYEYLGIKEQKQWVQSFLSSNLLQLKEYCPSVKDNLQNND